MTIFSMNITDIQPSQLYINKNKLSKVEKYLDLIDINQIEPIPIKRIGEKIFLVDGHTRAFALFKRGINEIKVYWDNDELDWIEYLICIDWCNKEGIHNIGDFKDRIIDDGDYQKLWLDRCKSLHKKLKSSLSCFIDIKIVQDSIEKSKICELILRSLPEWFGIEEAIIDYINGVKDKVFFSAYIGDIPVGFLSIKDNNEFTSEIYVMGILKEFQGRGIGKKLIENSLKLLVEKNKKFLTVKTLGPSDPDENYRKTRKFYSSVGFYPLEEFTEIWGKENPCLIMVKSLYL